MAVSLNEGSYGLLMDPLNGAADIEARTLRLVSNYGFLEEPAFLIRANRYKTRLGWDLDPRTQSRYDNAREENIIEHLSAHARSYELEQIGHEDDGLKVLAALETEGWMNALFPAWRVAKADEAKLKALHDLAAELQIQGVHPEMSAAQMQLLAAKLPSKDLAALKKLFVRPGFVEEWNSLDALAAGFSKALITKPPLTPSATYKLFLSYDPKAVLWLGFTATSATVKDRYEQFLKVWPEARQRIPHALMQELRITPDLPTYNEIVEKIFLELIDGHLTTPEEAKAFLEPFSPPAPPPQITIKRSRAKRAEAKLKERAAEDEDEAGSEEEPDLDDVGGDDDDSDLGLPKLDLGDEEEEGEEEDEAGDDEEEPAPKRGKKAAEAPKGAKSATSPAAAKAVKESPKPAGSAKGAAPAKTAPAEKKATPAPVAKAVAAKAVPAPVKTAPAPVKAKPQPAPAAKKIVAPAPAKKAAKPAQPPKKVQAKPAPKLPVKAKAKAVPKAAPAKKKPAPKPAKAAPKKPTKKR